MGELKKTVSDSSECKMEIEDGAELKEINKNSQKSEETPTLKVIIKEFARQNIKEKENQPLNSNDTKTVEKEETTSRWRSCTQSAEMNGQRSQVPLRGSWYQRSHCAAQTRESSEGVTALARLSRAGKSNKFADNCLKNTIFNKFGI